MSIIVRTTLIFIFSFSLFSYASTKELNQDIKTSYNKYIDLYPEVKTPQLFSSYHRNYFLLFGAPAKFQIGFKYKIWFDENNPDPSGLYLAFSYVGLWHLGDDGGVNLSHPFVDQNYRPEAFYLFDFINTLPWYAVQLGFMHESNGVGGNQFHNSVAWDQLYVENHFRFNIFDSHLLLKWRFWIPIEVSDNPDILQYYGIGSLSLLYKTVFADKVGFELELMLRKGLSKKIAQGAIQFILSIGPFFTENHVIPLGLVFEIWNGYGETLLLYKKSYTKFRFGLSLLLF